MKISLRKKGAALFLGLAILTGLGSVPAMAAENDAARRLTAERDTGTGRAEVQLYQADENFTATKTTGFQNDVEHYVAYTYPDKTVRLIAYAGVDGASLSWRSAATEAGSGVEGAAWTAATGTVDGAKSALEITPTDGKDTYIELKDTASKTFVVKLETASPQIDVEFFTAAAAGDDHAAASVTVSGTEFNSLVFTMQVNGGVNATGLSDSDGGAILNYTNAGNYERINVLTGKGYDAADVETPDVGSALTTTDGTAGWKDVSLDGKVWFSYDGSRLDLADITYHPAEKALTVTLMAAMSGGDTSTAMTAVDATGAPVEVFRFWYGLQDGKNGAGLGDVLEAVDEGDEFLPLDIAAGGNDNVVQDVRFGPVTRKELPSLVNLMMELPLKGLTANWGDVALLLHQTDATMEDKPANGFDLEVSYYNLYVVRGNELKLSAQPGKAGGTVTWKKAVVETGAAAPTTDAGWTADNSAASQDGKSVLTLTPEAGKDTYLNINGYQLRIRAMDPNIDVRFNSNTQDAKVSAGSVVLSGAKAHAVTFTLQGKGGEEASGFTDAAGSLAYENYTGYARVNLLTGAGYTAEDAETAGAFPALTAGTKDDDGWITYRKGDQALFSYHADTVGLTDVSYYPAEKAITVTVTATAENMALGMTTLDTMTNPAELFRFYFGLKTDKTGWNLKTVFQTDEAADDFRVLDVNGETDNALHDAYLGNVSYQKLPTLVKRTLIPHTTGKISVDMLESSTGYKNVRWTLMKITGDAASEVETILQDQQLTDASNLSLLLDKGSYRLILSAPGYLPDVVLLNNVDPEAGEFLEHIDAIRLYPGNTDETNGAYVINLADRQALLNVYGRKAEGPMAAEVKKSDFNEDNIVDIFDMGPLLTNMGKSSNGDTSVGGKTNYTAHDQSLSTAVAVP